MTNKILKELENYLPLTVEDATWNYPILHFYGKGWGFSTMTAWRLLQDGKLITGSDEDRACTTIENLKNLQVISFQFQLIDFPVDPVFIFSNNYILEIFSTFFLDPWLFGLPNGSSYNGNPADPNWIERMRIG